MYNHIEIIFCVENGYEKDEKIHKLNIPTCFYNAMYRAHSFFADLVCSGS